MRFGPAFRACCLLLIADAAVAAPCAALKTKPDYWVTGRVNALVRAARKYFDDEKNIPAYNRVVDGISATIDRCKLDKDSEFNANYPEFLKYINALSVIRRSDHELGFNVPDKQYFAETQQYVEIPEYFLDQKFLTAVSRSETLPKAKAYLRALNSRRSPSEQLIFFSYESRHLGTPDNEDSFQRLLIVVPGDQTKGVPEKWVQFGVTDPGVRVRTRNVSVVTTTPAANGTTNVFFKDFFRSYKRNGTITLNGRWDLGYGDDNCVQCHKSGILPIFPEPGSVSADESQALAAVNERFRSYGTADFQKYRDESQFGPGLSSAGETDRQRRFGKFLSPKVAGAMNCSSCHNKSGLGTFNWPMDQVLISSFIKGGRMPYGSDLKPAEREQLYESLVQEYFAVDENKPGILKSWLLGKRR
ncbi:MAG TPA: cytochrome c [Pyrinomonadaceae bacterium]|nr:cytochrome c [Pyrinomonadaceae bacterium]